MKKKIDLIPGFMLTIYRKRGLNFFDKNFPGKENCLYLHFKIETVRFIKYGELAEWFAKHPSENAAVLNYKPFSKKYKYGELAEWLNAAVLKTVKDSRPSGVRIPDSPQL